ncbi:MAG TPA: DUF2066 domain-containing protein [Stellaceae bacterium]|nr:DUF2066 domain-containing protein [Stellaceae bacterium]
MALAAGLALLAAAGPVRAQDTDPYAATVTVDATADSVIKARETARIDGQRRALDAVVQRLSGGTAPAKLPKLDDQAITNLVASFAVANERMSAVRYVADYTFHFNAAGIKQLVGSAGIAAAAAEPGKPMVVLPVYQSGDTSVLWDDPNPWRDAWETQSGAAGSAGAARVMVPLGDAGDLAAIDAEKARSGDPGGLAAIAQRNGGGDVLVALAAERQATDGPTALDVTVRDYRAGQLVGTHLVTLSANPGESEGDFLRRAVAANLAGIAGGWKKDTAGVDQQGTLTAVLPITGLDDWVRARQLLAAVPTIRKIALMSLSRQEATIEIGYLGSIDQLKASLAGVKFDLTPGGPGWRIARSASDRTP